MSSWTARAIQRNAVSKNHNNNKTKTNKQKHFLRFIVAVINMLYPKIKHYNLSCSLSQQLHSALYQIFCSTSTIPNFFQMAWILLADIDINRHGILTIAYKYMMCHFWNLPFFSLTHFFRFVCSFCFVLFLLWLVMGLNS